jgi:hypothetical protein
MKKSIILLCSILLFWACKENVESTPACNPKAIAVLNQHLVGKWNMVGALDVKAGFTSVIEFKNDGTIDSPTQFLNYNFFARNYFNILEPLSNFKYEYIPKTKTLLLKGSAKDGRKAEYDYFPDINVSCDRVDLLSGSGRLSLYKDNYKIPVICGADTSKGNVETWLVGKWNYSIEQYPYQESNLIRTPKGIVEFKDDFTVADSNPFGIVDALTADEKQNWKTKPHKIMWFKIGGNEKDLFFMFASQSNNQYYAENIDNITGICYLQLVSCDKIIFNTSLGHDLTLNRVK